MRTDEDAPKSVVLKKTTWINASPPQLDCFFHTGRISVIGAQEVYIRNCSRVHFIVNWGRPECGFFWPVLAVSTSVHTDLNKSSFNLTRLVCTHSSGGHDLFLATPWSSVNLLAVSCNLACLIEDRCPHLSYTHPQKKYTWLSLRGDRKHLIWRVCASCGQNLWDKRWKLRREGTKR